MANMRTHYKKLIVTLLLLFACGLGIELGFWQLSRAQEKREMLADYAQRQTLPPLTATDLQGDVSALQYRKVLLRGTFDNAHSFLLDNRMLQQQAGYEVLTPFVLENNNIILINRGWIAREASRQTLPMLPPVNGEQTLSGTLVLYPTKFMEMGNIPAEQRWPRLLQNLNFDKIQQQYGAPLLSAYIQLDSNERFGFIREWSMTTLQPSRHTAYAVQWFGLAGVALVMLLIVLWKRK